MVKNIFSDFIKYCADLFDYYDCKGANMSRDRKTLWKKMTATGAVTADPAILKSMILSTDTVNDPTITLYNSTAATGGTEFLSTEFEASYKGINGFVEESYDFPGGVWVVIANIGTGFVSFGYRNA